MRTYEILTDQEFQTRQSREKAIREARRLRQDEQERRNVMSVYIGMLGFLTLWCMAAILVG